MIFFLLLNTSAESICNVNDNVWNNTKNASTTTTACIQFLHRAMVQGQLFNNLRDRAHKINSRQQKAHSNYIDHRQKWAPCQPAPPFMTGPQYTHERATATPKLPLSQPQILRINSYQRSVFIRNCTNI